MSIQGPLGNDAPGVAEDKRNPPQTERSKQAEAPKASHHRRCRNTVINVDSPTPCGIFAAMNNRSYLKNVFWPNIGVGISFQVLDILEYACGLKLAPALTLNQNPVFEMASDRAEKRPLWIDPNR